MYIYICIYTWAKPALPGGGRGLDVVTGGRGPSVIGGLVVTLRFKRFQLILSNLCQVKSVGLGRMFYQAFFKCSVKSGRCIGSTLRMNVLKFQNSRQLASVSCVTHSSITH